MGKKINIAELLKDCPKGMELDCTMYDNVTFDSVSSESDYPIYSIKIVTKNGFSTRLTKYGQNVNIQESKCVIFPKGRTTWEGFVPPCQFKDGDIVYVKTAGHNHIEFIFIFKEIRNDYIHKYVCFAYQQLSIDKHALCHLVDAEIMRLATEEEKEKLFQAIKDNGYKWNSETKTLEKLFEPKFKVGDRIKTIYGGVQYDIKEITDTHYTLIEVERKFKYTEPINDDKNWELVPNKFNINTLKPFDKVLMRSSNAWEWVATFYSHYSDNKFYGCGMCCDQCIPYEGNEHLLGTTNDCDGFYKTWN